MDNDCRYWFKSSMFDIEPGEDEETNPRMYGRQLARWLRERFLAIGYDVEDVIAEDFGWCVMCQRRPYLLWIGCVSCHDEDANGAHDSATAKENIVWTVAPVAEVPVFKRLFGKVDTSEGLARLDSELRRVLDDESRIVLVDAPE